jgi:prepilin-type N-terminal cleavage/methylation domain-containing protein
MTHHLLPIRHDGAQRRKAPARPSIQSGFSLLEMLTVVTILGIVAAVIVPRVFGGSDAAKVGSCQALKGDIEIQTEMWRTNTGVWPAANLATIGADINYFPGGLPVCPVDGTAYTIDPNTGLVVGHTH